MLHSKEILMRAVGVAAIAAAIIGLPNPVSAQSGSARAAFVSTTTVHSTIGAAVLPSGGGYNDSDVDAVDIAGLLGSTSGSAITSGMSSAEKAGAQATASLANVSILAGKIRASSVIAIATAERTASSAYAGGDGSSIGDLVVNGVSYDADSFAPNTRINLAGVGYVVFKEIVQTGTSVTVNMIHVVLTAPLTGLKIGDIIVGSASSSCD